MDINLDGADDIAIGAPSYVDMSESPLQYTVCMLSFTLPLL